VTPFVPDSRQLLNVSYAIPIVTGLLLMTWLLATAALNLRVEPQYTLGCGAAFYSSAFGMWGFFALFLQRIAEHMGHGPSQRSLGLLAKLFFLLIGLMILVFGVAASLLEPTPQGPMPGGLRIQFIEKKMVAGGLFLVALFAYCLLIYSIVAVRIFSRYCCIYAYQKYSAPTKEA
jgi:hypothetical protein